MRRFLHISFAVAILLLPRLSLASEIHAAARAGDAAKVKALLEADPRLLEVRDEAGSTPLLAAAAASLREPVESNPYLMAIPEYAAKLQTEYMMQPDVVKVLLAAGAGVDSRDNDGYAALHWAAMRGNRAIIEMLLAQGASVGVVDKTFKATPLHMAVRAGHPGSVEALLNGRASVSTKDKYGKTPVDYAKSSGNAELINLLKRRGARK